MAITKRTRFEVLRRDEHTCQYCGAKAPDVTLHMDHVMPVSLGGTDKPENLVTACKDCNAGKSSIAPDAPLVQKLSAEASAYALGMIDKMTRFRADIEHGDRYIRRFNENWETWHLAGDEEEKVPLPPDYELSIFRWAQMGIPFRAIEMAIPKAMAKPGLRGEGAVFQYLAGIVWSMVNAREIDYSVTEETAAVMTEGEAENARLAAYDKGRSTGWHKGFDSGKDNAEYVALSRDVLQHHIDQMEPMFEPNPFTGKPMFMGLMKRGT